MRYTRPFKVRSSPSVGSGSSITLSSGEDTEAQPLRSSLSGVTHDTPVLHAGKRGANPMKMPECTSPRRGCDQLPMVVLQQRKDVRCYGQACVWIRFRLIIVSARHNARAYELY